MRELELTEKGLGLFSIFGKITRVTPSDYNESDELLVFVVDPYQLGRAIGKKGANIEKLKKTFRKKVVVVADSDEPEIFVRNFFNNVRILDIESRQIMNETAIILIINEADRGIAIGRNGERIKALKNLMKRKFDATIHLKTRRVLEQ
jgi:N utilization substance protein A